MAPNIPTSLTITQNTKLTDINNFLSKQNPNKDILARKDSEGNTVLYTRGSTGKDFFRNIKDGIRSETVGDGSISIYNKKRELATKTIAGFLKTVGQEASNKLIELDSKVLLRNKYDELEHPNLGEPVKEVWITAQTLVDKMLESNIASRTGATAKLLLNLEVLTGRVTRILEANAKLKETIPDFVPNENKTFLGSRPLDFNVGGEKETVDAPMLLINGREFAPDYIMGKGNFGAVVIYSDEDNTRIAVKLPNTNNQIGVEIQREKAAMELYNGPRMMEGNPNATGFTSHVELEGGFIALIGEPMENGDISNLAKTISKLHVQTGNNDAPPSGKLGDFERRIISLTILKDAANGIATINDKGLTHGDVKALNMMVSSDGMTKMIDLGEGMETSRITPDVHDFAGNGLFGAPEYVSMKNDLENRNKEVVEIEQGNLKQHVERIKDSLTSAIKEFGKENQKEIDQNFSDNINSLVSRLENTAPRLNNYDKKVGDSFDTFGLGTVGVELILGGFIVQENPSFAGSTVEKWANSKANAIGQGGLRESTGQPELDDLLNGMLSSDPKTRLTPEEVRDHYLMENPAIGSKEARNLILAIAGGKESEIENAVRSLRLQFNDQL